MRVEAPISGKSSVCLILTRARGLGILTIKKINMTVNMIIYCLFVFDFSICVTQVFSACSCFSPLASFLWSMFECFLAMDLCECIRQTSYVVYRLVYSTDSSYYMCMCGCIHRLLRRYRATSPNREEPSYHVGCQCYTPAL